MTAEESGRLIVGKLDCSSELFDVYPVSRRVNNPINNDLRLLKDVTG